MLHDKARILIVSNEELLGDGLVKLPFLWQLRTFFPKAHITWLTRRNCSYATLLKEISAPYVDTCITNTKLGSSWTHIFCPPQRFQKYDLIINTEPRLLRTLAARRIPHKHFFSFHRNFLFSDFKPTTQAPANQHNVVENLLWHLSTIVGKPVPFIWKNIPISDAHQAMALKLLPPSPLPYIGLAPGSGGRQKCWPLTHFATLGQTLLDQGFQPVYLIGPQETEWVPFLQKEVPGAYFPLQEISDPCAEHTIALSEKLSLGVANDAGGAHLMASARIPLMVLYGPTPPTHYVPHTPRFYPFVLSDFKAQALADIPVETITRLIQIIIKHNPATAQEALALIKNAGLAS